jgi:virginiamycin A acetyltransferase
MTTARSQQTDLQVSQTPSAAPVNTEDELQRCVVSDTLYRGYRWTKLRRSCLSIALRFEGGDFYSETARRIFARYHGVTIGAYSYGSCFLPGAFDAGVTIGRYVSVGPGVRVFLRNHPTDRLSMHPFFYNDTLGFVGEDAVSRGSLEIGHDAWLGANSIVTPGCSRIGIGAVVAAGAIVTRDVEDFAVVAGNPARIKRHRFSEQTQRIVLASRWWERTIKECIPLMLYMVQAVGECPGRHPLLTSADIPPANGTQMT